jgi:hypothetical protein
MGGARHRVGMYTRVRFLFARTCRHGEGKARNLLAEARGRHLRNKLDRYTLGLVNSSALHEWEVYLC